ncbi:DNA mismatch repair protein msh6 [Coemansia spiralis]|uniref:DNA mismatch repair protein n=2 Tax=Coemansia TaxID=4863 RepID=A0A9W8G6H3_9FUNG|nr:DNA mismatch repair protein msh6 [Coemansia umbellata]KAJ2622492.1 DNA mismatch repair protein msh6 [Coemansia sp. RSA 1358]KAJ2676013.1 DNA mismatch repair protein msh6 [Coemansia spiralis]
MPNPSNSSTPKSARTQSTIFSFFSTPAKKTGTAKPTNPRDSQDELLEDIDASIDSAMLAEAEMVEKQFATPNKKTTPPSKRKHKPSVSRGYGGAEAMDVEPTEAEEEDDYEPPSADDDDADDDYNPERNEASVGPNGSRRNGGSSRGRVVDDSDDDENDDDEMDDEEIENSQPLRAAKPPQTFGRGRSNGAAQFVSPELKRTKYSSFGSSRMQTKPALTRNVTSLPAVSTALSSPIPLTRNTQDLATPEESKRARVAKFAKKNEERYAWLEDVRDAQKLRPSEPGYDKRTLFIPPNAWNSFSPFERQYWEIKSKHWDTVVFFKKGKFYELYENDATIGHQEFDLKLTDRVNMRMAGIPESSFEHWVAQFLANGHKVARVDQMESKLAKDMRERGSTGGSGGKKGDTLVTRELTGVLTAGTLVDPSLLTQDLATYCMAIVEAPHEPAGDKESNTFATSFGVAFVDTSTAQFYICTVKEDDADRSGLETLLVQTNPREVIYVRGGAGPGQRSASALPSASLTKGSSIGEIDALTSPDAWDGMAGISQATWRTLKNTCSPNTYWIAQAPRKEFWDIPTTKLELANAGYFAESGDGGSWPEALQQAAENERLAFTAAGGLIAYLRSLKLDKGIVSLGNFSFYSPMQHSTALVLDGPTISNLDMFTVSSEGGGTGIIAGKPVTVEGTLFALLNHACTPFGRRLLSRWLYHPLRQPSAINARLDAVEFFMADSELCDMLLSTLKELSDIERGLSRIHSGRCKVPDFMAVLNGLRAMAQLVLHLRQTYGEDMPTRIQTLLRSFPPIADILDEFSGSFDSGLAASESRLLPFPGNDQPYDDILESIAKLDAWLEDHLKENRKRFDCASIVYKNMGKEHYQLEMPASIKVPNNYFRLSATKAVNRYWSPELRARVQERAEAMETKSMVLDSYQSRLYARFDKHYGVLMKAVSVIAEIDCLLALSVASCSLGSPANRPSILESNGDMGGYIEFRQLRHPCVALSGSASGFVANDIVLGRKDGASATDSGDADAASMILLTGPNMGGKSTLLRQLCLGVILAQLGCYVPAESATILPVDRLFTRIGARDNLLAGRSTFMVEMAETSTIMRYATPRSLVVLDELGRGTSTHDGEAVAYGVLHGLCSRLGCLGFFSTHYGLLAEALLKPANDESADRSSSKAFASNATSVEPHLRPMYMACSVNEEEHRVTFLYKLQSGVASKSHGMNVAAMAGVPIPIVNRAREVAEKFELSVKQKQQRGSKQMVNGICADGDSENGTRVLPMTLQSDFANLLRIAELESATNNKSTCSSAKHDEAAQSEEVPVGGTNAARRANENQYWSCIVDHLRRAMPASS